MNEIFDGSQTIGQLVGDVSEVTGNPFSSSVLFAAPGLLTPPFSPNALGGLLAEYDFLEGDEPTVLYDRSPAAGANGTIGTGGTWQSYGFLPGGSAGWASSGVPWADVRTVLVFGTPKTATGGDTQIGSTELSGGVIPVIYTFIGAIGEGEIFPRVQDVLRDRYTYAAGFTSPQYPLTFGVTLGVPLRLSLSGVEPLWYLIQDVGPTYSALGNVAFGDEANNGAVVANHYHYALLFGRVLSLAEIRQCHKYMENQCKPRGIAIGGSVTKTANILGLVGNSLIVNADKNGPLTSQTFYRHVFGVAGATPLQIAQLAQQATLPMARPLADYSIALVWPTPNLTAISEVQSTLPAICAKLRGAGWKVVVLSMVSCSGKDDLKNSLNTWYDDPGAGVLTFADGYCDMRDITELSADGASSNPTYFVDGTHLTSAGYALAYPAWAASVDLLAP